jgi:hypothetical protein
MKTAEKWMVKLCDSNHQSTASTVGFFSIEEIRMIQFDAHAQGIEDLYNKVTQDNINIKVARKMLTNKHD